MRAMDRRRILAIGRLALGLLVLVAIAYQAKSLMDDGFFRPLRYFAFFTILSNLFGAVLFLVLAARWRATRTHTFDVLRGAAVLYLVVTFVVVLVLLSGAELQVAVPWVDFVVHKLFPLVVVIDWLIDPPSTDLRLRDVALWLVFPIIWLVVTFVVVLVLLSGAELQVAVPWVDFVVHKLFPIVVVIDWLIDPPSTDVRTRDVALWLVFPIVWVVVTLARGAVDHWYPYPFLDPANGGYRSVAYFVGMILAGFLVIGGAVNAVSDVLRNRTARRPT
jgi:cell division protein FtsW (lipid II flippase)